MRKWCHIFNCFQTQTRRLKCCDSRFSSGTWSFYPYFNFLNTVLLCFVSSTCSCFLSGKWCALARTLKPTVPALAQHMVSPLTSDIVTYVLLKVALMFAIARVTLRLIFSYQQLSYLIFIPLY